YEGTTIVQARTNIATHRDTSTSRDAVDQRRKVRARMPSPHSQGGDTLMQSQPLAIEMAGLTKQFGRLRAVDTLNLAVRSGSVFGFLGPNGAGKTTTIRMLLGLIRPTQGNARVLGHDI